MKKFENYIETKNKPHLLQDEKLKNVFKVCKYVVPRR